MDQNSSYETKIRVGKEQPRNYEARRWTVRCFFSWNLWQLTLTPRNSSGIKSFLMLSMTLAIALLNALGIRSVTCRIPTVISRGNGGQLVWCQNSLHQPFIWVGTFLSETEWSQIDSSLSDPNTAAVAGTDMDASALDKRVLSGPLNRLNAQLYYALLQPFDCYRTPSVIASAIGRPSRPISHPCAGRSSQPPRSKQAQPRDSGIIVSKSPLEQARNKNAIESAILDRVLDRDWTLNCREQLRTGPFAWFLYSAPIMDFKHRWYTNKTELVSPSQWTQY